MEFEGAENDRGEERGDEKKKWKGTYGRKRIFVSYNKRTRGMAAAVDEKDAFDGPVHASVIAVIYYPL
jgi:hypothetical protein